MAGKVLIGCKLPHGLQLQVTGKSDIVVLNGQNINAKGVDFYIAPSAFGETEIDADFWAQWKKENAGLAMVKNGLIFEAPVGKSTELAAKAADAAPSKLEPLDPGAMRALGVAPDSTKA